MVETLDFFYFKVNPLNQDLEEVVNKIKELQKYQQLMIVRDDPENTTAMINIDNHKKHGFSKRDFVFHLPKSKRVNQAFLNENKDRECSICREKFKMNEYVRFLPECDHIFHKKCIDNWFYQSQKYECPLCRNNFYKLNK